MADTVELLKQYKELLDAGIITQAEFETKREQLLSEMLKSQHAANSVSAVNPVNAQPVAPSQVPAQNAAGAGSSESTFGWAVLGFFIPLVGLILFLVWNKHEDKAKGKSAGIGALVGVIAYIILWALVASTAANPYFFTSLFHKNNPEYYDPNPYDDEFDYNGDGYLSGEEKEDYYYYTYDGYDYD